jgi:hypothetical protein
MNIEDRLDEIAKLWEEKPKLQECILSTLTNLVIDLRENAQRRRFDPLAIAYQKSPAWDWLTQQFQVAPSYNAILELAEEYSKVLGIELTRETKRRMDLLIGWFNSNLTKISERQLPPKAFVE